MRRDRQRLADILEALDWVANATAGLDEAGFLADEVLHYAVAQRLTTVGEAVGRLSPDLRQQHASVPWADVIALRNILVHEYFGIHWPLVWQTVVDHAPILRARIASILASTAE